ncbi:protein FAM136A-like [Watersipora subatra]|uniref:protein FAM136A-like n=1 Tax=Watersipora subatra TaxID=2589382 RepID=UPI00355C3DB2
MEESNSRVQVAINKLVDDVDKSCLRKMQIEMFQCSAQCCQNYDLSVHQVQECVQRCQAPSERADQYLQSEMQGFQSRLQRCAMDCKDKATDKLGANPTEKEKQAATSTMEKCVVNCVDTNLLAIPKLFDRITQTVKQQK